MAYLYGFEVCGTMVGPAVLGVAYEHEHEGHHSPLMKGHE